MPGFFVKSQYVIEALEISYNEDDKSFYIVFWGVGRKRVS
jgi:hypothetical protein